ncbi:uncharacterized protein [Nicotiana tomentosiformis]|uniref:uncharacterized protein n=1 Tax=Nicotiana tomentosiformis TaxID=4098 RepID=UPI00388C8A72
MKEANVNTISGSTKLIEGSGRANLLLPGGTNLAIDEALYCSKSQRNLLSFKDIRQNGYHIETTNEEKIEYLYITTIISGKKYVLEILPALSSGLYYTSISKIKMHAIVNEKFTNQDNFIIWHDRLGHPGSTMMRKIIENSHGHSMKNHKILQFKEFSCAACSQGKLIIRPSAIKVRMESPTFLEHIQGDICGPIHPPCGPFRYYMILEPNISHLRIFGCAIYVPIAPPQHTKMGLQRRLRVYVGYESPSIIKYLEPMTGDLFTTRFSDCHFDESVYPILGGENKQLRNEIDWNVLSISHLDSRTNQCEQEVQKIIHLQNIANQLPDAFTDLPRVTKSHIPAANAPIRVDIPVGQLIKANNFKPRLKRGRPIGSKDKNPRKRKGANDQSDHNTEVVTQEEHKDIANDKTSREVQVPENDKNEEISISYVLTGKRWNRNNIVINNVFAYNVAIEIMQQDEDLEPKSVDECIQRNDWPKWEDAIQAELTSLAKREVFGSVVQTPNGVKPVGYKWIFVHKRNEKNEDFFPNKILARHIIYGHPRGSVIREINKLDVYSSSMIFSNV